MSRGSDDPHFEETTVSGVLERELDGIASAHIAELSAALPGFAEAHRRGRVRVAEIAWLRGVAVIGRIDESTSPRIH